MNSSEYLDIFRTQKSHIPCSVTIGEKNVFLEYFTQIGKIIKGPVFTATWQKGVCSHKETKGPYGQDFMGQASP